MSHPDKPTPDPKAEVRLLKAERRQIVNAADKLYDQLVELYVADLLPPSVCRRVNAALHKWDFLSARIKAASKGR